MCWPRRPPTRFGAGAGRRGWSRWSTPGGARCSPPPTGSTRPATGATPTADRPRVGPRPTGPSRSIPEALAAWLLDLAEEAGPVTVVGDGAVRYRRLLAANPRLDLGWAAELSAPPPLALADLARRRLDAGVPLRCPPVDLLPDYRRPADARINWEQRAPRPDRGHARAAPGPCRDPPAPAGRLAGAGDHRPHADQGPPGGAQDRRGGVPPALVPPAVRRGAAPADVAVPTGPPGSGATIVGFAGQMFIDDEIPREQHRRRSRSGRAGASAPSCWWTWSAPRSGAAPVT